jgi:hypothetical protein
MPQARWEVAAAGAICRSPTCGWSVGWGNIIDWSIGGAKVARLVVAIYKFWRDIGFALLLFCVLLAPLITVLVVSPWSPVPPKFWDTMLSNLADGDPAAVAQVAAVLLLVPTIPFAWRGLRENRRTTYLSTRASVIQHCALRYDDLYKERSSLSAEIKTGKLENGDPRIEFWFRRFWGLKSDQVDFYLADWIDVDTMRSWMFSNCETMRNDTRLGVMRARESWIQLRGYQEAANPMFALIIDVIAHMAAHDELQGTSDSIALTDELLLELERKSRADRRMVQRRYSAKEFIRNLDRSNRMPGFDRNEMRKRFAKRKLRQGRRLAILPTQPSSFASNVEL